MVKTQLCTNSSGHSLPNSLLGFKYPQIFPNLNVLIYRSIYQYRSLSVRSPPSLLSDPHLPLSCLTPTNPSFSTTKFSEYPPVLLSVLPTAFLYHRMIAVKSIVSAEKKRSGREVVIGRKGMIEVVKGKDKSEVIDYCTKHSVNTIEATKENF